MPRNSTFASISKKTFKSYIDLDISDANGEPIQTTTSDDEFRASLTNSYTNKRLNEVKDFVTSTLRRNSIKESVLNRSTTSLNLLTFNDTVDGVNYFYSHTNRSTGICGQLSLNSNKLTFSSYNDYSVDGNDSTHSCFAPFLDNKYSSPSYIDIYLLNVGDMKEMITSEGNFILLSVYCADFRCLEFQMKNCDQSKRLIDKLRRLTDNGIVNASFSKLTKCLKDNYPYFVLADWEAYDGDWFNCFKLRLTQCNESFQISDSLPPAFIVPKMISDSTLINSIATQTKGQRVPIVTYLYLKNGNLLIRCPAFEFYEDLNDLLKQTVTPLRQMDLDSLLLPLIYVEQAYERLRDACYLYNDGNSFHSKIGKWMTCMNVTFKVVSHVTKVLTKEASVGLVEDLDKHWNCVVSCLVQIILDPNRRTFKGFEALISKEWFHIPGHAYRPHIPQNPNHILFTLFLDCIWQLMILNPQSFEFSSFYLIWLFDCQYMQLPLITASTRKSLNSTAETHPKAPPITNGLSVKHLMIIHNPFYNHSNHILKIHQHIGQLRFWSTLYLRWHSNMNNEHCLTHEMLYLNELKSRKKF